MTKGKTRRSFIKKMALSSSIIPSFPYLISDNYTQKLTFDRSYEFENFTSNDQINIALIGCGIQGIINTNVALQVPGVKLIAVCDLYNGRLDRAKELWGKDLFVSRDYRLILNRTDVDAVIVATPDHWHRRITIDSMESGKAIYCEKPMIQNFNEGHDII